MEAPAPARKLTTHQQAVLIQVLLAFPEQRVRVEHCDAGDAPSLRAGFSDHFQRGAVGRGGAGIAKAALADGASGLAIVVCEDQNVPPGAEALRDALRIYGIEVETMCDSAREIAAGEFVFSVGAHPSKLAEKSAWKIRESSGFRRRWRRVFRARR